MVFIFLLTKVGAIAQLPGIQIPNGHFVAAFVEDVWILGEIKVLFLFYLNSIFSRNKFQQ